MTVQGRTDTRFARVRATLEHALATVDVGAAVALSVDGRAVVDLSGGFRDRARREPWKEDTLCCVFSTTKGVTAIAALLAVARAELDLDAYVVDYWPEFANGGKQTVRVHHLLTHRAGLVGFHEPFPRERFYDSSAVAARLETEQPWWEPGTAHGYHARTFGFLLDEVLRRASGRDVAGWLRELGADIHIGLSPALQQRCADALPARVRAGEALDVPKERRAFLRAMNDPTTPTGAAFQNPSLGVSYMNSAAFRAATLPAMNGHATARALATVYGRLAMNDGGVLPRDLLARATQTWSSGFDRVLLTPMTFGLGFQLGVATPTSFGHSGAGGSIAFADPVAGIGFAYVMNQLRAGVIGMNETAQALVDAVYEALA
jgi:CubicO group peptidase (beta-lactamase class C family)